MAPLKTPVKKGHLRILGLETSCDETSVALLEVAKDGSSVRVKKHLISTQIEIHAKYGGVVPEVAARTHVAETVSLLTSVLGKKPLEAFDVISVTYGPGLATALRVGIQAAQTLAWLSGKPLIGVNHLEGHLASAWLLLDNRKKWKFPALALLVSGGHTELVLMRDYCDYTVVGSTRDDAAGEAFDKSAKLMGLGYPGGPKISQLAVNGDEAAFKLPRPMLHEGLDMSFSGLKTAIRTVVEAEQKPIKPQRLADLCASIEKTILDVLITKTVRAAKRYDVKTVLLVGGVSANPRLRVDLENAVKTELKNTVFLKPSLPFSTDNAAMIAAAGAWRFMKGTKQDWKKLDADPELEL